jgi:hypothetical protein
MLQLPQEILMKIWPEERVLLATHTSKALRRLVAVKGKSLLVHLNCARYLGRRLPEHIRQEKTQHKVASFLVRCTTWGVGVKLVWRLGDSHKKEFERRKMCCADILSQILFTAKKQLPNQRLTLRELTLEEAYYKDSLRGSMLLERLLTTEIEVLHLRVICGKGFGRCGWPDGYIALRLRRLVFEGLECMTCGNEDFLHTLLATSAARELCVREARPAMTAHTLFSKDADLAPGSTLMVPFLQKLEFDHCDFGHGSLGVANTECLARALARRQFPALTHFSLTGCRVYLQCATPSFVQALRGMPMLQTLDLSHGRVGVLVAMRDKFVALLHAIAQHPALRELNLSHTGMGPAEVAELVPGLQGSRSLRRLVLDGTDYDAMCTLPEAFETAGAPCRVLPGFVTVEKDASETARCLTPPFPAGAFRVYLGDVKGAKARKGELRVVCVHRRVTRAASRTGVANSRGLLFEYPRYVDIFEDEIPSDVWDESGSEAST